MARSRSSSPSLLHPLSHTKPKPPQQLPSPSRSPSRSPSPEPPSPHTAAAQRTPSRPWNAKDEAHLLSLHHLTYSDARFNPPVPSVWKRLALVALCVVLVWCAFSARLGMWERKREVGRRSGALRYAKMHAHAVADASLRAQNTRPTVVPAFENAVPHRDEM